MLALFILPDLEFTQYEMALGHLSKQLINFVAVRADEW